MRIITFIKQQTYLQDVLEMLLEYVVGVAVFLVLLLLLELLEVLQGLELPQYIWIVQQLLEIVVLKAEFK